MSDRMTTRQKLKSEIASRNLSRHSAILGKLKALGVTDQLLWFHARELEEGGYCEMPVDVLERLLDIADKVRK